MTRTPESIVRSEVHYCVSYLVSTLAGQFGSIITPQGTRSDDFGDMIEQAFELACPIDDWEEAALQNDFVRWYPNAGQEVTPPSQEGEWWYLNADPSSDWFNSAQEACEANDIEPYQREVFEHWIVSDWLADKLEARGEKVDKDFAGMIVWARTTSGQGIAADSVIERIAADLAREG